MKRIFLIFTFLLALLPALFHFHIVKKDFYGHLTIADGLGQGYGYCFERITAYAKIDKLTGISARPPLVPILLVASSTFFGHSLLSIYLTYLFPRLLIYPLLFFIARRFFSAKIAYLVATLPLFFPFFETYALSTLKADVFVVALSLLSLYFVERWLKERKNKDLAFAAIFLSLNVLSKETAPPFSATMGAIIIFHLLLGSGREKMRSLLYFLLPWIGIIGPFMIVSFIATGRLSPSLYATAVSIPSFPQNIATYILSVPFYSGINFTLSKSIALTSILRLIILLTGIWVVLKRRLYELILPVVAVLVALSLIETKVVQGDSIGNIEILHRIALVVPFVSLYFVFGIETLVNWLLRKYSLPTRRTIFFLCLFLFSLNYIYRYFQAPFALDYADREYYLNASSIFRDRTFIPRTTFTLENNLCVITSVPAWRFMQNHYQLYKTSAFPPNYDKLLVGLWLTPITASVFYYLFRKYRKL